VTSKTSTLEAIRGEVAAGKRFLLTSHVRPDGDAIGSELALAFALDALGKHVEVVNRDPVPEQFLPFPGTDRIVVASRVTGEFDAAFVLECGDATRPGLEGLERHRLINIDHHAGNGMYGVVNWFDPSASACGELVFELVEALGVPLSTEIATHVYLAILTDTGSFHYSNITPRTFDICRRLVEAGVVPETVARQVYDTGSPGKLRLIGALLSGMRLEAGGRLALLYLDAELLRQAGATYDDTDGLINLPLSAKQVQAVAMFKTEQPGELRVSLRSKGSVDVRTVAERHGGGGHRNAAGFTLETDLSQAHDVLVAQLTAALDGRGDA
jgi:phosphoesterase RecJ-like protein